ncbi:MAG: hypothetical protein PHO58_04780 [Bacilli bacterium]|nr:hypothetical protein [Bacilli bacterium]
MLETNKDIPKIDTEYICIVNDKSTVLAGVVSSYFGEKGVYLPFFDFPFVNVPNFDGDNFDKDGYVARIVGSTAAILINNAMARMEKLGKVIFVGLDDNQKSYLRIPTKVPIIEIKNLQEAEQKLLSIGDKKEVLKCKSADILSALFVAKNNNQRLEIDENAPDIILELEEGKGIIVLEKDRDAIGIVAVNYAYAVDANLYVVDYFGKENKYSIETYIQKWRESGDNSQLQKVINEVLQRIGSISFEKFTYATFFTIGLPYSLAIKNIIPCGYVPLALRADLFIFNSIIFEGIDRFNSAVVFSPGFFTSTKDGEETKSVIDVLNSNNYLVRPLIGINATVNNLDFHAQHFPYDILHICTHGGEVDGYSVIESYKDRKGVEHIVEYDEVIGFAPIPGKDLIGIHRKTIFRKFDGYVWMSEELKSQKYENYIYEDMRKELYSKEEQSQNAKRFQKKKIPTSCAIACVDSIHQGMFQVLASHSSPLIFNNACWSWSEVSNFFLACGARGYIGTLWDIENNVAVIGANTFYSNVFNETILSSFFEAIKKIRGTASEDIYIYWGLHFTTLSTGISEEDSRGRVFKELIRSFFGWMNKIKKTKNNEVKKNSIRVLEDIHGEIINNFKPEDLEKLDTEIEKYISGITFNETRSTKESIALIQDSVSIEHPVEFRGK